MCKCGAYKSHTFEKISYIHSKQNCESQMICCHTLCPHGGWWSSHLDARLHMSRASSTVCSSAYWVRVPSPCTVFLLTFNSEIINSHELAKKKVQKVSCKEKCTKGFLITIVQYQMRKSGLPWWFSGWESTFQCRGHKFDLWSGN